MEKRSEDILVDAITAYFGPIEKTNLRIQFPQETVRSMIEHSEASISKMAHGYPKLESVEDIAATSIFALSEGVKLFRSDDAARISLVIALGSGLVNMEASYYFSNFDSSQKVLFDHAKGNFDQLVQSIQVSHPDYLKLIKVAEGQLTIASWEEARIKPESSAD